MSVVCEGVRIKHTLYRGSAGSASQREKERQQLLAEIDEKKRKILREVEV